MSLFDAGFAALTGERRAERQGRRRQGALDAEDDDDDRQGRFHERPRAERVARADHRHAMGEGAGGLEVQARLSRDRTMPPTRTCRSSAKLIPFNG